MTNVLIFFNNTKTDLNSTKIFSFLRNSVAKNSRGNTFPESKNNTYSPIRPKIQKTSNEKKHYCLRTIKSKYINLVWQFNILLSVVPDKLLFMHIRSSSSEEKRKSKAFSL